jgi:diacylglycerol O-acyltransferase
VDEDRFALVVKLHHAMVDGLSGIQIALVLLDAEPAPPPVPPSPEPWAPRPAPRGARNAAMGAS